MPAPDQVSLLVDAIFRLNGALIHAGDELAKPAGLSAAQWQVLGYLRRQEAVGKRTTAAELARARGLRRQSVQETVNRLALKGMLIRQLNPGDRRAPVLELTESAHQALALVEVQRAQWADKIGASLGDENIAQLLRQVEAVQAALSAAQLADSAAHAQAKVPVP